MHFGRRPLRDDAALGHEVQVVDDLERLVDVVRDDDRRDAERVVQLADELADDAERNRIESRERLVVHHEHRIERDRARERDAARHAARQLRGPQLRGAAQADRVQLHEDQVADERVRQLRVLAHRKRDVLEHRHVGEQRAELEQHADLRRIRNSSSRDDFPTGGPDTHLTRLRLQLAADQAQDRGLAAAGAAHDRDDLAPGNGEVDPAAPAAGDVAERHVGQFDRIRNASGDCRGIGKSSKTSQKPHWEERRL